METHENMKEATGASFKYTVPVQQMAHACHVAAKPGDLSMVCRNGLTKRKHIENPVQARNSPNVANISVDANE